MERERERDGGRGHTERERERWGKWENKKSYILHHTTLSCTQGIN